MRLECLKKSPLLSYDEAGLDFKIKKEFQDEPFTTTPTL